MHTLKIHLERMFDNIGIEMAATYDPYAWVSWNSFVPGILRINSNEQPRWRIEDGVPTPAAAQ